jgi:putative membrane protein
MSDQVSSNWPNAGASGQTAPPVAATPDQQQMALERTYLAHERTLMAWIRTGASLVTFGISLSKFFEHLYDSGTTPRPLRIFGPNAIGLLMVVLGVVTLLAATWQHRQAMRRLGVYDHAPVISPALVLNVLMACLGIVFLVSHFLEL